MADAIGMSALRHFGEQHLLLGGAPCSGHAGLGIDHDLVGVDRLGSQERRDRKLRAARVAARIGDKPRLLDLVAIDLDQSVDRLALQLRCVMFVSVPFRIGRGVGQPEVGRKIDHLRFRRLVEQVGDHLLRRGMRQCAECEVELHLFPIRLVDRHQLRQPERRELREHRAHLLAGTPVGGEQHEVSARMAQQQPHQLRAGVTRGAEDADFCFGRHGLILICGRKSRPDKTTCGVLHGDDAAEPGPAAPRRSTNARPCRDKASAAQCAMGDPRHRRGI